MTLLHSAPLCFVKSSTFNHSTNTFKGKDIIIVATQVEEQQQCDMSFFGNFFTMENYLFPKLLYKH